MATTVTMASLAPGPPAGTLSGHHRHATGDRVPGAGPPPAPLGTTARVEGVLAFIVPLARIVAAIVVGWKEPKSLPSAFARPSSNQPC